MTDRAVLSRSVQPLEDDEKRVPFVGGKPGLQIAQTFEVTFHERFGLGRAFISAGVRRIDVGKTDLRSTGDSMSVHSARTGLLTV